ARAADAHAGGVIAALHRARIAVVGTHHDALHLALTVRRVAGPHAAEVRIRLALHGAVVLVAVALAVAGGRRARVPVGVRAVRARRLRRMVALAGRGVAGQILRALVGVGRAHRRAVRLVADAVGV